MAKQTDIWKQTLYKVLDDSEITQTIAISEDDAGAFRVVQLFDLKRYKTVKSPGALPPRAMYCRDSVWETSEVASLEAQRLVAKYLLDHWQIIPNDQTAQEAS